MKAEEWKQIVIDDVEYDYSVSSYGRVRNDKTGRILKARVISDDYLQVALCKNGKQKQLQVHRLVAIMFIPNDEPTVKTVVHHLDHNRQNNHVDNLEWATVEYNVREGNGKRVRCIETGIIYDSTRHCAKELGLCHVCIHDCCKGKQKTSGGFHWEFVD